jgi:hypothetical protein
MVFRKEIGKSGSGELQGTNHIILSSDTFEDGLKIGRFAKLDSGSIDNMDGSLTPVIAGVVARTPGNAVEDDGTYDTDNTTQINYVREGLVTVDVIDGDTPTQFGIVWAVNGSGVDDGLAAVSSASGTLKLDGTTNNPFAEFVREVDENVWVVRVK